MKLTIEVDLDAHDDIYYKVIEGDTHIVAERINGYENLMLFVGAKIKSAFGRTVK